MAQIVYTKTQEDYQTGEIVSRTWIKRECSDTQSFVRAYISDIGVLARCSGAEQSVILCCMKYLDYNTNELILTSGRRKEICTCSGLKLSTVNVSISRLYKKNILIKYDDKTYLNPILFFYGTDIERNKLFELKIQYRIPENE